MKIYQNLVNSSEILRRIKQILEEFKKAFIEWMNRGVPANNLNCFASPNRFP